jgi:hypothetical protein
MFVNWVMNCVTLISFAIIVNGLALDFFKTLYRSKVWLSSLPIIFLLLVGEGLSKVV